MNAVKFLLDFLAKPENVLTSAKHARARVAVCHGCDKFGKVEPVPMLVLPGCTLCGCPAITKPRTLKYYSTEKGEVVETACPHEDGNKWAETDKKFINQNT